ncbi:hypothetical protein DSO57_1021091 [Entomophthora muscae]|uniref:Uncharacterized protein n=1 Tax=Entomophthora muscae TaxID=34485 RepID=A0ACC2TEH1_9FUNG|nr:hypothetical protein DSO57_1021091 [Entomophthora muscae]
MLPVSFLIQDNTILPAPPPQKETFIERESSALAFKPSETAFDSESRSETPRDPRPLRPIHYILKSPDLFAFEVSDPRISVVEASIDPNQLKLSFTLNCLSRGPGHYTRTVCRTLDQIAWLHNELHRETPFMALGLPHSLLENTICLRTEASALELSLEAKRFQVERYLACVLARSDTCLLEPLEIFLSNSMEQNLCSTVRKSLFDRIKALSFSPFSPKNEDGVRPLPRIKADASLDDEIFLDIDDFQKKRSSIVAVESSFKESHQTLLQLNASRESLTSSLSRLGDSFLGALHSRHRLGPLTKLENRYKFRRFDVHLETLATLFDDLGVISQRQGHTEASKLGSIFEEYIVTMATLKATFNNSVDLWSEYLNPNQLTAEAEYNRASFKSSQQQLVWEYDHFNTFKAQDTKNVIKKFARLQLNIEKAKLAMLKSGLASSSSCIPVSQSSSYTSVGSSSLSPT